MASERARSYSDLMIQSRHLVEEFRLQRVLGDDYGDHLVSAARECLVKSRTLLKKPFVDPLGPHPDDLPSSLMAHPATPPSSRS